MPNELYKILTIKNGLIDINKLYGKHKNYADSESIIDSYLEFLIKNEFGILIKKGDELLYPHISKNFDTPAIIDTTIFNVDDETIFSKKIIKALEEVGCNFIVLNIVNIDLLALKDILTLFNKSRVSGIEIFMEYSKYNDQDLSSLINEFERVNAVTLYNAPKSGFENEKHKNLLRPIKYIDREFQSEIIPRKFDFFVWLKFYLEALKYNVYYNKKMFVDEVGNISNQYNGESYGNINNFVLANVINDKFKKNWSISKDVIEVCKDCEFRYMCLDSRIPLKLKDDKYKYLSECNYNPYEATWKNDD